MSMVNFHKTKAHILFILPIEIGRRILYNYIQKLHQGGALYDYRLSWFYHFTIVYDVMDCIRIEKNFKKYLTSVSRYDTIKES